MDCSGNEGQQAEERGLWDFADGCRAVVANVKKTQVWEKFREAMEKVVADMFDRYNMFEWISRNKIC